MGTQGDHAEGVIALGDQALLFNPGGGTVTGHQRNAAVTVLGADCVAKSYPTFWADYEKLGGKILRS